MIPFLIPAAVLSFALNGAVTRAFQLKFPNVRGFLKLYQALFCLVSALSFGLVYMMNAVNSSGFSSFTANELMSGILFGVFYFIAIAASAKGYETGSMSLTSIIMNMSLFISLVYSCLILGERLTVLRVIGIALIVVTMTLSVDSHGEKESTSLIWFAVVFAAFLANGLTAVIQKRYVLTDGGDTMRFMAVAYLTAAILFVADSLLTKRKSSGKLCEKPSVLIIAALVSGLGSFGGNALLGYLCDKVNGAILYSCVNGGLCIVSAIISFSLFGEQVTRRKICAILIGLAAIVLLIV